MAATIRAMQHTMPPRRYATCSADDDAIYAYVTVATPPPMPPDVIRYGADGWRR